MGKWDEQKVDTRKTKKRKNYSKYEGMKYWIQKRR